MRTLLVSRRIRSVKPKSVIAAEKLRWKLPRSAIDLKRRPRRTLQPIQPCVLHVRLAGGSWREETIMPGLPQIVNAPMSADFCVPLPHPPEFV